jgi:hypothetical protein
MSNRITEITADFYVRDEGSIVMFFPVSARCREWIDENVGAETWQWMGNKVALCVDHSLATNLYQGMCESGMSIGKLS